MAAIATVTSAIPTIKVGHIHDVQELRKAWPAIIPERFVRGMAERPHDAMEIPPMIEIPIIDLSELIDSSGEKSLPEMAKLAFACEHWGFFQVVNHGIELGLLESIERVSMEFFALGLAEKEQYRMIPGTVQGYGQAFIFSEDQKLDWCNMLALGLHPRFIRNPMLWPSNPSRFSETLEMYYVKMRELCQLLLRLIARSLGLEGGVFNQMFGDAVQAVRMNYYPSCSRPDLVLGLSPHSDGSALTVLQQRQDSTVVGLQILKDSTWVPVHPIPNALVINIGDTLEVLTNGKYKSAVHRAVTNKDKDRLSIATFYAPSYDVELGPLPEFIDKDHPCMYRRYNHGDYSRHYVTNKLQGKKSLDFAKIQKCFSN